MGLQVIQLDKTLKISGDNDIKRLLKRDRNKKQRRRLKNPDNEPEYNKYNGWFD